MESFAFPDKLKLKKFQIKRATKFMNIFQAVELLFSGTNRENQRLTYLVLK